MFFGITHFGDNMRTEVRERCHCSDCGADYDRIFDADDLESMSKGVLYNASCPQCGKYRGHWKMENERLEFRYGSPSSGW